MSGNSYKGFGSMEWLDPLRPVNYDRLILNSKSKKEEGTHKQPSSLMTQCCTAVIQYELAGVAMVVVPAHLAEMLLREAIYQDRRLMVTAMIANWPLTELCFRDIVAEDDRDVFTEEMTMDIPVFKGYVSRTKECKVKCIDFRGMELNQTFTKLIVQMWPMITLGHRHRNGKRLVNLIGKKIGLKADSKLFRDILPQVVGDLLKHEMMNVDIFKNIIRNMSLRRGEKLLVKLDKVQFSTSNTFFMDYLISHCIQQLTPVQIQVSNICIRSDLNVGDEIMDSLAPFIVFRGHDTKTLEGIRIDNLEDNVIFIVCSDLRPFVNLTALSLPCCNLTLREGRTRSRTAARQQITQTFRCLPKLKRLDLRQNCFAGCLPELLGALQTPLEYLNISECDIYDKDMEQLSSSKHAKSLKELNLSRTCGYYFGHMLSASVFTLFKCLPAFENLVVLHLEENHLTENKVSDICQMMKSKHKLKGIDISNNLLKKDLVQTVIECGVNLPGLQFLKVPYYNDILGILQVGGEERIQFEHSIKALLQKKRRADLNVQVSTISFSVLLT